jgi:alcohol dehydrogenase class IV
MRFEFATATRIIFGAGTLLEAGTLAKEFGRRALVVAGSDTNRTEQLTDILRAQGVSSMPFTVIGEPDV